MVDVTLLKNKYLLIASSGLVNSFTPKELYDGHKELEQFLLLHSEGVEAQELYALYELQFYFSILTGHDIEAKSYLDRLNDQFNGKKSQRIKLLFSLYLEATGDTKGATKVLESHPDELRLSRRLTTLSRKEEGAASYIDSLAYYLDILPSDIVAWAELAEEYGKVGEYDKGIFALKEILLQEPYAYNIFYKVGLFYYYKFLLLYNDKLEKKDKQLEWLDLLVNARNLFLRAVEIGGDYGKGWMGVYTISTNTFNKKLAANKTLTGSKQVTYYLRDNERLEQLAKSKLQLIHDLNDEQFADFIST